MIEFKTVFGQKNIIGSSLFISMLVLCSPVLAEQRLEMDGTAIIGNKELPKVLYIVPWKASEKVSLSTPDFTSVLDDPFKPVDRSTFKRELEFYNKIYASPDKKPN